MVTSALIRYITLMFKIFFVQSMQWHRPCIKLHGNTNAFLVVFLNLQDVIILLLSLKFAGCVLV